MDKPARGFFSSRQPVDYGLVGELFEGGQKAATVSTANVPDVIYSIITAGMATLAELQTFYGVNDAYDMLEIISVNNANKLVAQNVQAS